MSRACKRTRARDKRFFEALENDSTIGEAAKNAGYSRRSIYDYAAQDPTFAQRLEDAKLDIVERLEKEADRRALKGVPDYKSLKGPDGKNKIVQIRRYSDSLLQFRLKALAPDKYRDNYKLPELTEDFDDVSIDDIAKELGDTLRAFKEVTDDDLNAE